ncbi:hypothetical protein GQ457_10G006960 [Hibiscus cannabinus]
MFECAFLLDEVATSFVWLFKSFLESIRNQAPKTIMTDQDHAISKAIEEVFPNSCLRLCLWHISKNVPSHLGSLNANLHKMKKKTFEVMMDENSSRVRTIQFNATTMEIHCIARSLIFVAILAVLPRVCHITFYNLTMTISIAKLTEGPNWVQFDL